MPLPTYAELFYDLPLTEEQQVYADSIFDNRLTIANAKSGSGKTTVAVGCAKIIHEEAIKAGNPNGKPLLYIFTPVQEKAMGFRKGDQEEKESEYLQPLKDALVEIGENPMQVLHSKDMLLGKINADNVWVEAKSHVFARGTNIKGKTVIIDEAQNFTRGELKKVLTRIHDDCTVIIIGHTGQIDLPDAKKSGFEPYMTYFSKKHYCQCVVLTKNFRGELAQDADDFEW
jgi:phosphate starvation-inducible protein PhoH